MVQESLRGAENRHSEVFILNPSRFIKTAQKAQTIKGGLQRDEDDEDDCYPGMTLTLISTHAQSSKRDFNHN